MRIIEPSYKLEHLPVDPESTLEMCARTCYKSESRVGLGSASKLLSGIIARGHESVLEHLSVTVRFVVDRGVSHELVRHRLASYSQESTRYVRYAHGLTFIRPCFWEPTHRAYDTWVDAMQSAEDAYLALLDMGARPEEARDVLPISIKTEVVMTANLRAWRHILRLRCSKAAHPQMRQVMAPLRDELAIWSPVIFSGI